MSHDLSHSESNAFALARTLMVPVTLFEVEGQFGVYAERRTRRCRRGISRSKRLLEADVGSFGHQLIHA